MSETLTNLDWWAATRYPNAEDEWAPASGRHAYNEEAALTPIFQALTRGGWRSRQHEPAAVPSRTTADPVDEFRRDPLTAPIPVQALGSTPSRRREQRESGRHHRSREAYRTR